jgi:hypothetical protein
MASLVPQSFQTGFWTPGQFAPTGSPTVEFCPLDFLVP